MSLPRGTGLTPPGKRYPPWLFALAIFEKNQNSKLDYEMRLSNVGRD